MPDKDRTDPSWVPELEEMENIRRDMAAAVDRDRGLTTGHEVSTTVNHPAHYNVHPSGVECIEVVRLCSYNMGNAIKYIWRYEDKDGHRDLSKARWSMQDILSSGEAHHPPHKAKVKLARVIAAETDPLRTTVLYRIMHGQLNAAIQAISELIGEDDVTEA